MVDQRAKMLKATTDNLIVRSIFDNQVQENMDEIKSQETSMKNNTKIPAWDSESLDGLDWLRGALFLLDLNTQSYSDKTKIGMLMSGIRNNSMRIKLVNELRTVDQSKLDMKLFEDVFRKMVTRDTNSYKQQLKEYKYNPTASLNEMYTELIMLVQRSTGLNEEKDKMSIEKLGTNYFLEKLPKEIRRQLVTFDSKDAKILVEAAERCRSYSRVYLQDDEKFEVNNMEAKPNSESSAEISRKVEFKQEKRQCTSCGKVGHLAEKCWGKDGPRRRPSYGNHDNRGQSSSYEGCFYCGKSNHNIRSCYQMQEDRELLRKLKSEKGGRDPSPVYKQQ